MYQIGKIKVTAVIPEQLKRLNDLAYNLWWTWNTEVIDLFKEIDSALWEDLHGNPVRFIQEVSQQKLEDKIADELFINQYNTVINNFDSYMQKQDTWFNKMYNENNEMRIVYFSAEYGLTEVLPIYSGGLGVLSGDHCKSASDLGLPFTGIGLLYKHGYFSQRINRDGWQEPVFHNLNLSQLPVKPVLKPDGKPILISVELPGRVVYARIWQVSIGRIKLYLMDSDVAENNQFDRGLTAKLYGGDQETRIQQEVLLGIGGIRVLEALGVKGTVYHMNEGHSSFMGLELIRKLVQEKHLPFIEAKEIVNSQSVFTTHTPVPAGNDAFPMDMIDRYFSSFWGYMGIQRHEFMQLGMKEGDTYNFNMTVLAFNIAGRKNGVSELHGAVSRTIFNSAWPGVPEDDVPITHITNGIHTLTWIASSFRYLYDKYLGDNWRDGISEPEVWKKVDEIPDEELWKTHVVLKTKMIQFLRNNRLKAQKTRNGESAQEIHELDAQLDSNALTIGFARRFATYKRANLIFRNMARIERILNNPNRPVQIIFAGKAHPADRPAHEVIKHICDIARQEGFKGKVFLIENYNMQVARHLVQGVDVWMNNPRRPLEASGTSGQKVCVNGIANFSVLDGWWCEGYNGKNGWTIGDETHYDNEHYQDDADSQSIYDTLENEIIPLYYNRDERGIPAKWVKIMKESIKSCTHEYSTDRMVKDYTIKMYIPSEIRYESIIKSDNSIVKNLVDWKHNIIKNWPQVNIVADSNRNELAEKNALSGETISVSTTVQLGSIQPKDVAIEIYYGIIKNGKIVNALKKEMTVDGQIDSSTYKYSTDIRILDGGEYGYTFRILPKNEYLINQFDMKLIKWA